MSEVKCFQKSSIEFIKHHYFSLYSHILTKMKSGGTRSFIVWPIWFKRQKNLHGKNNDLWQNTGKDDWPQGLSCSKRFLEGILGVSISYSCHKGVSYLSFVHLVQLCHEKKCSSVRLCGAKCIPYCLSNVHFLTTGITNRAAHSTAAAFPRRPSCGASCVYSFSSTTTSKYTYMYSFAENY